MNSVTRITETTKDRVLYENGMIMKVHESGILSVMFNTKERWCAKTESSGFDPKTGMYCFGFWFSSDESEYSEEILLEWPSNLASKVDFRTLSEQNKDQVELFFIPWEMFK